MTNHFYVLIMFKRINRADILLCGWCLYYLQGVLYPKGSIISQAILFFLLLVSIYYFFRTAKRHHNPPFIKGLNALVILFSVYGLFFCCHGLYYVNSFGRSISTIVYLQLIFISLLPIYSFYELSCKGYIDKIKLTRYLIVFIIVASLSFYNQHNENIALLSVPGSEATGFTNNIGYVFLAFFPFLGLLKKSAVAQYCLIIVILIFVIYSMKRGAIIIGVICVVFFFVYNVISKRGKSNFLFILVSVISLVALSFLVQNFVESSISFQSRIEKTIDGDSSGRDLIYSTLWHNYISQTSWLKKIIGYGANGPLRIANISAHNDWLEILTSQGLLGVGVYLYYWYMFLKTSFTSLDKDIKFGLSMIIIIYFIAALFSMSYNNIPIYAACILGFYLSRYNVINEQ